MEEQKHDLYRANMSQGKHLVRCSCGYSKASLQTFEEIEAEHLNDVLVPTD